MESRDALFIETLYEYYAVHGRNNLPWRAEPYDPYAIMVSELMLQQTQVGRVIPKFEQFMNLFPTVQALAEASLGEVLVAWSGLGYNRRAKFLWQAAGVIMQGNSTMPSTVEELVKLPGIGINTAGAIMAYAYDEPVLFIETNVRTVYIHHYFADHDAVSDADIREQLERTLDRENPRQFYYALMDYGTHLKKTVGNLNRRSGTYSKQSTFAGSRRQVRGAIIRALGNGPMKFDEIAGDITDQRLAPVLNDLLGEGLVIKSGDTYRL